MYALELASPAPVQSAPYYSLVVREPYIVGNRPDADIFISSPSLSPEHLTLTVLHEKVARAEAAAIDGGEEDAAVVAEGKEGNSDTLVVRVAVPQSKGSAVVKVGEVVLEAGDAAIVRDGDVLSIGDGVAATFHYRPMMVGVEASTYPRDYLDDLCSTFARLGAIVVETPVPLSEAPARPVAQLYCVEELNDSSGCLAALACGYSIVQPTYVFEWFAAVAKSPASPLSLLPPPSRYEVPIRFTGRPTSTTYLRPEPDTCPFSLFPLPPTAMTNRERIGLFMGKVFFFFTDAAAARYWRVVEHCGGAVYGPGDIDPAKEAVRRLVVEQLEMGASPSHVPQNYYIIIDNTSEAVLLNTGLAAASPELSAFIEEAYTAYGATHLPIMGDHSLFTALLSNRFIEEPVPLVVQQLQHPAGLADGQSEYLEMQRYTIGTGRSSGRDERASMQQSRSALRMSWDAPGNGRSASAGHLSHRESERRSSLLPRSLQRTPSRSQMRSYSRQRARSASLASGGEVTCYGASECRSVSTSASHGRRRLVPSLLESAGPIFADDFDVLRVRIYAFLMREEPKLDKAVLMYHRNYYVPSDTMEYALEMKAQAMDYMERIDELLADEACHGAYTDSLRRFWRDCSDINSKAQHLLHCWDRSMALTSAPSRSRSRRGSATSAVRRHSPSNVSSHRNTSPVPLVGTTAAAIPPPQHESTPEREVPKPVLAENDSHYDPEATREHREIYISPDSRHRLDITSIADPAPLSHRSLSPSQGGAGVVLPPSAAVLTAASISVSPAAASQSPRPSRRRSVTPLRSSQRRHRSHQLIQRPPWVDVWTEANLTEEASAAAAATPAPAAAAPVPHPTPRIRRSPRGAAAGGVAVATDSPSTVRPRSASQTAGRRHASADPPVSHRGLQRSGGEAAASAPPSRPRQSVEDEVIEPTQTPRQPTTEVSNVSSATRRHRTPASRRKTRAPSASKQRPTAAAPIEWVARNATGEHTPRPWRY